MCNLVFSIERNAPFPLLMDLSTGLSTKSVDKGLEFFKKNKKCLTWLSLSLILKVRVAVYIHEFSLKTVPPGALAPLSRVISSLPQAPGVYQMMGAGKRPIYIGKAKNLLKRVKSYAQTHRLPVRLRQMVASIQNVQIIRTRTEGEALLLEAHLIQKYQPAYNIVYKDNKSLPYLYLSGERWAQLRRFRGNPAGQGTFFGPFPSVAEVAETQKALQKTFMLRTCSDAVFKNRTRPCLQYDIKRCSAPCVGKISEGDYAKDVQSVRKVLEGKTCQLQAQLTHDMERLSNQRRYEEAAAIRNRIQSLASIQQKQSLFLNDKNPVDILGVARKSGTLCLYLLFFRGGVLLGGTSLIPISQKAAINDTEEADLENQDQPTAMLLAQFYDVNPLPQTLITEETALLSSPLATALMDKKKGFQVRRAQGLKESEVLQTAQTNARTTLEKESARQTDTQAVLKQLAHWLDLPHPPDRIEVYDNTHLQGTNAYGAMVVDQAGRFNKNAYRLFRIAEDVNRKDDYAMMHHMLSRRFRGGATDQKPDLLIIDGGKGQLSQAHQALSKLTITGIPILAIAKGPTRGRLGETFYIKTTNGFAQKDLKAGTPLYFYLERLRDEAHRFGITRHKAARLKSMTHSSLNDVPGLGPKRKKALLHFFGALAAIKEAPPTQLALVPGISKDLAQKIYEYFRKDD